MACDNLAPLTDIQDICCNQDLWDTICIWLSGDALCCAASASKMLRVATQQTPAFVLLAGINNDAQVVPWSSPANVMSAKYDPKHILNCDREVAAIQTAEKMLWQADPNNWHCARHHAMHRSYVNSGPARPPSPQGSATVTYEPCKRPCFWSSCDRLNPPVFGVRAGFSYAPFWDVLIGPIESSDDSEAGD